MDSDEAGPNEGTNPAKKVNKARQNRRETSKGATQEEDQQIKEQKYRPEKRKKVNVNVTEINNNEPNTPAQVDKKVKPVTKVELKPKISVVKEEQPIEIQEKEPILEIQASQVLDISE